MPASWRTRFSNSYKLNIFILDNKYILFIIANLIIKKEMIISAAASIFIKAQRRSVISFNKLLLVKGSTPYIFIHASNRTFSANNDEGKASMGSMFSNRLKELRKSIKASDVDTNAERLPPTSDTGQFDLFGQARG